MYSCPPLAEQGKALDASSLEEIDVLWEEAKGRGAKNQEYSALRGVGS